MNSTAAASVVLVPVPGVGLSDAIDFQVLAQLEAGFTGTCTGVLQGSLNRYSTSSSQWISLGTPVSITSTPTAITTVGTSGNEEVTAWPALRILFDGTAGSGVGIVDWAANGVFCDLNVMNVGQYSSILEGGRV